MREKYGWELCEIGLCAAVCVCVCMCVRVCFGTLFTLVVNEISPYDSLTAAYTATPSHTHTNTQCIYSATHTEY